MEVLVKFLLTPGTIDSWRGNKDAPRKTQQQLATELNRLLVLNGRPSRDFAKIKNKINGEITKYKEIKADLEVDTGAGTMDGTTIKAAKKRKMEYFAELDDIMSKRHAVRPPDLLETPPPKHATLENELAKCCSCQSIFDCS